MRFQEELANVEVGKILLLSNKGVSNYNILYIIEITKNSPNDGIIYGRFTTSERFISYDDLAIAGVGAFLYKECLCFEYLTHIDCDLGI